MPSSQSSLSVTWNLSRGTRPGTRARGACLVEKFVCSFTDPGLWPRMGPLFSLPVSLSGGGTCSLGPVEGAGCPGSLGAVNLSRLWPQASFPAVPGLQVPFPPSPGFPASLSGGGASPHHPVCRPCQPSWADSQDLWPQKPSLSVHWGILKLLRHVLRPSGMDAL